MIKLNNMAYSLNHGVLYLEEIYTAIANCEKIRDSAIILLMLSSNMNSDTISTLKVGDLLDACNDYLDDEPIVEKLLDLDPWSIIPCWKNVADTPCVFLNTHEATFYMLLYLKKRINAKEKLTPNSPLFIGRNNSALKPKSIRDMISSSKLGDFHVDFSQTSLLKTFKFVCENYCEDINLVNLLLMEEIKTNPFYNELSMNIREVYRPMIPFLTAKSFDSDINSNFNVNEEEIISNYYKYYMKHRNKEYDYTDELKIKKRANKLKNNAFTNESLTPNVLELIYKYAECECLMLNTHFLTECNLSERAVITEYYRGSDFEGEWIKNCFKELGIIEILQISNERLEKEIIKQSVKNDVNLSVLTYCGLIKIFDGLMESVLLNK